MDDDLDIIQNQILTLAAKQKSEGRPRMWSETATESDSPKKKKKKRKRKYGDCHRVGSLAVETTNPLDDETATSANSSISPIKLKPQKSDLGPMKPLIKHKSDGQ